MDSRQGFWEVGPLLPLLGSSHILLLVLLGTGFSFFLALPEFSQVVFRGSAVVLPGTSSCVLAAEEILPSLLNAPASSSIHFSLVLPPPAQAALCPACITAKPPGLSASSPLSSWWPGGQTYFPKQEDGRT